jgi:hypothetical protein
MPFPSRCIRKLAGLPDHLIRLEEHRRRNGETEGLRSLEVDDQLVLHRLRHRESAGLAPFRILSTHVAARRDSSVAFAS